MQSAASSPANWRGTLGSLALGQILCWAALYYAFSCFVLPMHDELHWDKATLMGAMTLGLAVWGAGTYAVGAAIDQGHGRFVMTLGALLAAAGCAGWSFVSQPWMLYAVWALLGAAMAMTLYDPAFAILTKRYPQHYRQGITTLTLVGGFASTLAFPAVNALVAGIGWRHALWVIAAVLGLLVAPLHAWALRGPAAQAHPAAPDQDDDATLHQALRTRAFWLLALSFTLFAFATGALWAHAMPIFVAKGLDELAATAVLVWIGPAQVLGRLVVAGPARGVPLRGLGLAVLLALPVSLAILALSHEHAWLLVFALVFGLSNGLFTILRGAVVPEFFGRRHIGRISGAMTTVGLLARAAAPLLAAWLLLWLGSYAPVLLLLAAIGVLAALAYWLARPPVR
jgi:MFS family permease